MRTTRRHTIALGAATLAGLGTGLLPRPLTAQGTAMEGDAYPTQTGQIVIHPVSHASFVMSVPGMVVYNDPVGGAQSYAGLPAPELILVTHEHGDHYDAETLAGLMGEQTRLLTNPAVYDMLPEDLRARATAIANGESTRVNEISIDAIPAYNLTPERLQYHPQGRDNGYVLGIDGTRVYIAGDTEDIPEMRALEGIDVAFVPMNLPYTMTVEQAASGVAAFGPGTVYPYHYRGSDIDAFAAGVAEQAPGTRVERGDWYPAS